MKFISDIPDDATLVNDSQDVREISNIIGIIDNRVDSMFILSDGSVYGYSGYTPILGKEVWYLGKVD